MFVDPLSAVFTVKHHLFNLFCACADTGELDYSSVLLGMLVMQDVQLGLFIAVMPTLIQGGNGDTDR